MIIKTVCDHHLWFINTGVGSCGRPLHDERQRHAQVTRHLPHLAGPARSRGRPRRPRLAGGYGPRPRRPVRRLRLHVGRLRSAARVRQPHRRPGLRPLASRTCRRHRRCYRARLARRHGPRPGAARRQLGDRHRCSRGRHRLRCRRGGRHPRHVHHRRPRLGGVRRRALRPPRHGRHLARPAVRPVQPGAGSSMLVRGIELRSDRTRRCTRWRRRPSRRSPPEQTAVLSGNRRAPSSAPAAATEHAIAVL